VIAAKLTFAAHAGTNRVRFAGRLSKRRKLKPGSPTLLVTASSPAGHSPARTLRFTIAG
jgi:hypothetical protein